MTNRAKHRRAVRNFKRSIGPLPLKKNIGRKNRRARYWFAVATKNFGIVASKYTSGCGDLS